MPVDQTSLDRIRNATFPSSRRGYDKHEVEKFLARLADWLETGPAMSPARTRSSVSWSAWDSGPARFCPRPRRAPSRSAPRRGGGPEPVNTANMEAAETRTEIDNYASETRTSADAYSQQTRQEAEEVLSNAKAEAEKQAREALAAAEAQARRIVEDGTQRREDIEAVIKDLVRRRNDILADTEELSAKLTGAVSEHRPDSGSDPFDRPNELDPLDREGEEKEFEAEETDDDTSEQTAIVDAESEQQART